MSDNKFPLSASTYARSDRSSRVATYGNVLNNTQNSLRRNNIQSLRPHIEQRPAALMELDDVKTLIEKCVKDETLPAGSVGTIVHKHQNGVAFIVEFCSPFHVLATFRSDEIARYKE